MSPYRDRLHRLIDLLPDQDVEKLWPMLREVYHDVYMLQAIEQSKAAFKPGDYLTREEALRFLALF